MNNRILAIAGATLLALTAQGVSAATNLWPFFAFDNGVGRGVWPPKVQADTIKSLGYDGIHYNYTNPKDMAAKIAACKAAGVKIYAVYIYTFLNKPEAYDPGIKEAITMLKGSDTAIWMTIREGKPGQQDADAAKLVNDIASQAAAVGLKVSLYPHAGFYVDTAEVAVRVAKATKAPNVGVTVNLCHELIAGNGNRMAEVLKTALPYLTIASINGAQAIPGKKGSAAWETLALGDGSYDVLGYLKLLRDSGYHGPVGHQFYAVKGDDREKLTKAITTWKDYQTKLTQPASAK